MRKLTVFQQVSADGYFTDRRGDMSWAHKSDPEWRAYADENASSGGELLFGRITYEMMASFWPTPSAFEMNPVVAAQMNALPKVVFSNTLGRAEWSNTKLVKGDIAAEVRRMKNEPGRDMVLMGSGTIVSQLAREGLIDEYSIVVNPIILGGGRTMFEGIEERLPLTLTSTRSFGNGNVLLCYKSTGLSTG